jgi:hypothetical protein
MSGEASRTSYSSLQYGVFLFVEAASVVHPSPRLTGPPTHRQNDVFFSFHSFAALERTRALLLFPRISL